MWPFKARGQWVDHQCKKPWPDKAAEGDRWQCDCGRLWKIVVLVGRYTDGSSRHGWKAVE